MSSDTDYQKLFRKQKDESVRLANLLTECRMIVKKIMDDSQYEQFDSLMRYKENQSRKDKTGSILEA